MVWVKVERQIPLALRLAQLSHNMYRIQQGVPCNGGTGWTYMVPNNIATDDRFPCLFLELATSPRTPTSYVDSRELVDLHPCSGAGA